MKLEKKKQKYGAAGKGFKGYNMFNEVPDSEENGIPQRHRDNTFKHPEFFNRHHREETLKEEEEEEEEEEDEEPVDSESDLDDQFDFPAAEFEDDYGDYGDYDDEDDLELDAMDGFEIDQE